MKRILFVLLILTVTIFAACGNSNSKQEDLKDTRASSESVDEIDGNEAAYNEALSYMKSDDYASAAEILENLEDYEGAEESLIECYYNLGILAFDEAEYDNAISYFELSGDYEDSADRLAESKKEKGMSENADNSFLEAIQESILWRMKQPDETDKSILVNTELVYVGDFSEKEFYDSNLKILAAKYVEGLDIQAEALNEELYCDYQIKWQQGRVYRFEVLTELYNSYGLLSDNAEFIGTYVSCLEHEQLLYDAYVAIENDIDSQADSIEYSTSDGYLYFTLANNTQYTFNTIFEFVLMDANETTIGNTSAVVENIQPYSNYTVSAYVYESYIGTTYEVGFDWTNYYTDVSW